MIRDGGQCGRDKINGKKFFYRGDAKASRGDKKIFRGLLSKNLQANFSRTLKIRDFAAKITLFTVFLCASA